jgi:ubiquinone/menaquinone biosynthesis C-methylase UbiE|tara:strand:- start:3363 stop:4082 length:720 start_codon:yes stop_codon:yes gene_type:complete
MLERKSNREIKINWYQDKAVVNTYEALRFGSSSGLWVAEAEKHVVRLLMDKVGHLYYSIALDIPTGTGRMIPLLMEKYSRVLVCDTSFEMLKKAGQHRASSYYLADAMHLALLSESIDLILCVRFLFHHRDLSPFFKEMSRILKPGGVLISDVYNWTPRVLIPGNQETMGGRVYLHRKKKITEFAFRHGFEIVSNRGLFFITPFVYRFMPLLLVKFIETIGHIIFFGHKTKTYYLLRKR